MTTYEIKVNGQHAATVSMRDEREIFAYVAAIRRVYDPPVREEVDGEVFEYQRDVEEGGPEITSTIVRQYTGCWDKY